MNPLGPNWREHQEKIMTFFLAIVTFLEIRMLANWFITVNSGWTFLRR